MDEQELLKMLREAFREEAVERLASLSNCLLQLERVEQADVADSEALEVAFREAHSLKGAARSVSLLDIELLCQSLESVLSKMKQAELALQLQHFDVLHDCVAVMEDFLTSFATNDDATCRDAVLPLVELLDQIQQGQPVAPVVEKVVAAPAVVEATVETGIVESMVAPHAEGDKPIVDLGSASDPSLTVEPVAELASAGAGDLAANTKDSDATLRVASIRLDEVMRKAEGMIALKLAATQRHVELEKLGTIIPVWKKERQRVVQQWRRHLKHLDQLNADECRAVIAQISDAFDQSTQHIHTLEAGIADLNHRLFQDSTIINTQVEELLEDVKEILMVPFSNTAASLPRMIRDISRAQGKSVDFSVRGEEVELDKRILEKMVSPLTHLLRNAIDHGIELPQVRLAAGKEAQAQVEIAVSRTRGGYVEIRIKDDGGGIDAKQLRDKAVAQGLMTQNDAAGLSHDAAVALIFNSGLSTSEILTEISGRGLGMAIVKQDVERLGGHLHVETTLGQGTCFKLHLPVSLSVFRGILIHVRGHDLVLPTTAVERVIKILSQEIKTLENREVIVIDGVNLALLEMGDVLAITEKPITQGQYLQIVVVSDAEQRLGFVVDSVDGEYELLVKGLGHHLQGLRYFSGASVLGDGRIVPILDARDLLASAQEGNALTAVRQKSDERVVKKILAADDSITSRMLIKNILESSGYDVVSAVDGADAYEKLINGCYDLVVSDVEMPHMNGFELTTRIRASDSVADIPVILVTSLETTEDKERGIVAGANAYIVKRSFDQTNLLDTVKRLL